MRILLKIELPTETANAVAKRGALGRTIQSILADQKPEAAYFTEFGGRRTGIVIVNLKDPSEIPAYAEPWFLAFNANIEFHPAMIPADLAQAAGAIEAAAKKYA